MSCASEPAQGLAHDSEATRCARTIEWFVTRSKSGSQLAGERCYGLPSHEAVARADELAGCIGPSLLLLRNHLGCIRIAYYATLGRLDHVRDGDSDLVILHREPG